jgi:diacylglycerol kinase family enzyme
MADLSPHAATGREVLILHNPTAGPSGRPRAVRDLSRALAGLGLHAVVCDRDELSALTASRNGQLRCVVAAGGDGTLNEALNRAAGLPVAPLALGNENLAARYLGQGGSPARLAQAVAGGAVRRLDLGRCEGRLFAVMASAGFDARVVHDAHAGRRGHITKLAYALPIWRTLRGYPFPPIEAAVGETGEVLRGAAVFVFNLPAYALRLPIAEGARPDDGWLDLFVFRRPGWGNTLRYLAAIVQRRHQRLPDVEHRRVRRVRLSSDAPVPVQTDGDPAGFLPVTVEVVPAAWRALAPGGAAVRTGGVVAGR